MNLIDRIWNFCIIKIKGVEIGKKKTINGRIYIQGYKKSIKIGDFVTINSKALRNPISGFEHTYLCTLGKGKITIGNNVGMSQVNIVSKKEITIGNNVLIGSGSKIWDTDFHSIEYTERLTEDKNVKSLPVTIKEGAFIGACSIILKGVTVGSHSIIGAGSVVTKNVPDNEIWAGNPARYIKKIT